MGEPTPPAPRPRGRPTKKASAASPKAAAAASPRKTRGKGKKNTATKDDSTPATPQQKGSASFPVRNAWPPGITPPSSTVPPIFAESPKAQTLNQGQSVKAAADQALDSPATESRRKAARPAVQQASKNGLATPTLAVSQPPKDSGLRTVGGLTMPSLPVSQPSKDSGLRTVGGLTMPSLPVAPPTSQAPANGLRTIGGLTMPSAAEPQASSQASNNGLRTVGGFTVPSIPEPFLNQPSKRPEAALTLPNNGQLRTSNGMATLSLPNLSQHPNTIGGTPHQARDLRATVDVPLPPFEELLPFENRLRSSIDHHVYQYFPKDQHIEHFSANAIKCPGCATPKEGCYPFWLCEDCTPDATRKREAEYQTLKEQYSVYAVRAKAVNTNAYNKMRKHQEQNTVLNQRIQELEDQNIKSMAWVKRATELEKENNVLQQRVHSQQRIVALYNQRYGADAGVNFTTTGEEPALTQTTSAGLMQLPGQAPSRGQSPGNQGVRQSSPNGLAMNRALSPGRNPNAVAMSRAITPHPNQAVSPLPGQIGAAMGHGRASSQGTIHFPSNQAAAPQPNPNAVDMNIGRTLSQVSNGVSMNQGLSPGRAPNGFAINHSQNDVQRQGPNGFSINHSLNGNAFDGATIGQEQGPNGFAMNQSKGFNQDGNGFAMTDNAVGSQGQAPNVFDLNQGGNSSRRTAYDSFHLQGGNVIGFRYPSPHP